MSCTARYKLAEININSVFSNTQFTIIQNIWKCSSFSSFINWILYAFKCRSLIEIHWCHIEESIHVRALYSHLTVFYIHTITLGVSTGIEVLYSHNKLVWHYKLLSRYWLFKCKVPTFTMRKCHTIQIVKFKLYRLLLFIRYFSFRLLPVQNILPISECDINANESSTL